MANADDHIKAISGKAVVAGTIAVMQGQGPGAVLSAAAAAGGLEAAELLSGAGLFELLRNPADRRLADEWARGEAAELDREKERLTAKIDRVLKATGDVGTATNNVLALFLEWRKARTKTTDPKKARILMAAFVNAFDSDAYRDGLNATLLQTISALDYGDLFFLKSLLPDSRGMDPAVAHRFDPSAVNHGTQNAPIQIGGPAPHTIARWHAERLLDARLVWVHRQRDGSFDAFRVTRTEVGDRLLALIGDAAFQEAEQL